MLVGKTLKQRYKITKTLGAGAFGNTYVAIDRDFPGEPHRVVKHLCPTHSDPVSLKHAKRLFKTEAKCLAKLGEYEQIPRLFSYFEEDNEFYLVQELIEGQNLTQEFQRGKKWSESDTVDFLSELLSILSIVHRNEIIHRDIKPANIMRRRDDNKLVLIDFGAVKERLTVDRNGKTTTIVDSTLGIGALAYMPYEQAKGKPEKSSDIYAVGMIGVQALTGLSARNLPSDSEGLQDIWQDLNIEVSSKLKSILEQMISFRWEQRFADADAALEALFPLKSDVEQTMTQTTVDADRSFVSKDRRPARINRIMTTDLLENTQQDNHRQSVQPQYKKKVLLALLATLGLASAGAGIKVFMAQPDYTQLETYLQNKDWKQADLETDRIIREIAREKSELDTQSIEKFPCKALKKLDDLWTKNSDGRFGFTPQKEAYLAMGNEFDDTYAESMYKAFGDRVDWWRTTNFGKSWNMYNNLKFKNNDAVPVGHLPSPGLKADGKNIRHDERGKLLSRFDGCGL